MTSNKVLKAKIKLSKIISESYNFSEAGKKLNISRTKVRQLCKENNIDYSHFKYSNPIKYIGYKNNKLTIISLFIYKSRRMVKCSCDCGINIETRLENVITGQTKSCGCMSKRRECMDGSNNPQYKGIGNIPSTFVTHYKRGAKRRNIDFNITVKDVYEIYIKQNKRCSLSGLELKFGRIRYRLETNCSIDRIDSAGHYTKDNIQLILKDLNIAKQSFTQDAFIELCRIVSEYNQRPN